MMYKKLFIAVSFLVTIICGLLISQVYLRNKITEIRKINLRLKWVDQAQFAGYYVADNQKLYLAAGLQVEMHPGGPEISPIQMVTTGVDDFGVTGADQILLAREKGIPLIALAVFYKDSPVAVVSLKTKNIVSAKDLEGKKVAVVYGRDEEALYRTILAVEGVNSKRITETPSIASPMEVVDQVDAQVGYELNGGILLPLKGYPINMLRPRDFGIRFYGDTLFTTEKMVREEPELVRKFIQATLLGWQEAFRDQTGAIDLVMKINSSLDREHQTKFLEESQSLMLSKGPLGFSEKEVWEEMQKTLINQGLMKSTVNINDVFTNDFL